MAIKEVTKRQIQDSIDNWSDEIGLNLIDYLNTSTYDDERLSKALVNLNQSRLQMSNEDLEAIILIAGKYA